MRIWFVVAIGLLACSYCPAADEGAGGLTVEVRPPVHQRVVTFNRDELGPTITLEALLDHVQQQIDPEAPEHWRLRTFGPSMDDRELDLPADGPVSEVFRRTMIDASTVASFSWVFRPTDDFHDIDRYGHGQFGPILMVLSYVEAVEIQQGQPRGLQHIPWIGRDTGLLVVHGLHARSDGELYYAALRRLRVVFDNEEELSLNVKRVSSRFGWGWAAELTPEQWHRLRRVEGQVTLLQTQRLLRLRLDPLAPASYQDAHHGLRVHVQQSDADEPIRAIVDDPGLGEHVDGDPAQLLILVEWDHGLTEGELNRLQLLGRDMADGQFFEGDITARLSDEDSAFVRQTYPRLRHLPITEVRLVDERGVRERLLARDQSTPGRTTARLPIDPRMPQLTGPVLVLELADRRLRSVDFSLTKIEPDDP